MDSLRYLSAELSLLSSLSGELKVLIAHHNCGLTYQAGDAAHCARCLSRLLDDPVLRECMCDNGKRPFDEQYDGRAVFVTLVENLETMARNGTQKETNDQFRRSN